MLTEAGDPNDPTDFTQSELFKTCRELGIIPSSETDLQQREAQSAASDRLTEIPQHADGTSASSFSATGANTIELTLTIDGMWCPACAWVVEQAIRNTQGVVSATCNFSTDRIRCRYDPVATAPDRIMAAVDRLGYQTAIPGSDRIRASRRRAFIRFGITAFLSMNVMMFSFALYSGYFSVLPQDAITKLSWPIAIMATVVLAYGGQGIVRRAWLGIVHAAPGMESLIAIGALSAYVYSLFNLLAGSIHLYFDTAAMLIVLVLLGKMLESGAKRQIHEDLDHFFALQPRKVRLLTPQAAQGRYVSIDQLEVRDHFQVEAPEVVPADGLILTGTAALDEASITGEATPVPVQPGDRIRSGARILEGRLEMRAEAVGQDSTLGQMIRIMETALGRKTPLEGRTDLVLKWFVPAVVAIAVVTGLAVRLTGSPMQDAAVRALTVLVISCPCALGLAIPLARVTGIAMAAKKGLLVRDANAFEQAARIDTVVFDKTGTVTEGRWELRDIVTHTPCHRDQALALAAGLEAASKHPIGAAIRRYAHNEGIVPTPLQDIQHTPRGICGQLNGRTVRIGSADYTNIQPYPQTTTAAIHDAVSPIYPSRVHLSIDHRLCADILFGDRLRQGSAAAIQRLQQHGRQVQLVSGDDQAVTQQIARHLSIDMARGGLLPVDKSRWVANLQAHGKAVAMVGDGVNDAPALAQSDLAVAVYAGGHLAPQASDITLMRSDPRQLIDFIDLARLVNRKVFQNLLGALIYNIVAIPIAALGWLSPLVAVSAMLLSSLTVIGNTLLLRRAVLSAPLSSGGSAPAA
jgi:heavy metal translocating P-type ATPase